MPALKNPRHEAFAQAIFAALFREPGQPYQTHANSYTKAGYTAQQKAAEASASRLLRNAKILDRVVELQQAAAEHVKETVDKCVKELNQLKEDAQADKAYGPAVSAVMGKAKLLGLVTDKHQDVTDRPDFSTATTLNDIGVKLLESVGYASPSPDDVALALEAHAAFTAQLEAIAERAQSLSAEQ
jgi:hypothetical protein